MFAARLLLSPRLSDRQMMALRHLCSNPRSSDSGSARLPCGRAKCGDRALAGKPARQSRRQGVSILPRRNVPPAL